MVKADTDLEEMMAEHAAMVKAEVFMVNVVVKVARECTTTGVGFMRCSMLLKLILDPLQKGKLMGVSKFVKNLTGIVTIAL